MISADRKPPFTAYRLTPKRNVTPVKIVEVEEWSGSTTVFVSERGGAFYCAQLWATELEAIEHVIEWGAQRKAYLLAELASLEARDMKLRRRHKEITSEGASAPTPATDAAK